MTKDRTTWTGEVYEDSGGNGKFICKTVYDNLYQAYTERVDEVGELRRDKERLLKYVDDLVTQSEGRYQHIKELEDENAALKKEIAELKVSIATVCPAGEDRSFNIYTPDCTHDIRSDIEHARDRILSEKPGPTTAWLSARQYDELLKSLYSHTPEPVAYNPLDYFELPAWQPIDVPAPSGVANSCLPSVGPSIVAVRAIDHPCPKCGAETTAMDHGFKFSLRKCPVCDR